VSLDLFGAEASTNAANYFAAGLKGRFQEAERNDDHRLHDDSIDVPVVDAATIGSRTVAALAALNATLQKDYIDDCQKGVDRWNRTLESVGGRLEIPHPGFHRQVGVFAGHSVTPDGRLVNDSEWESGRSEWLPTEEDRRHVASLMTPVTDPGHMAGWIAPPSAGIHQRPVDYEYVRVA
jgi:benzoyl-CoA 2,3-dioxygenase component B